MIARKSASSGQILYPEEAIEPILAKSVRSSLLEWLTELWATDDLAAVGLSPRKKALFTGAPGVGKAQPLTSTILMATGRWRSFNDIAVGDEVASIDGTLSFIEAVYPQGQKEKWTVTFSDRATVDCCADHLWLIEGQHWKIPRVVTTAEISTLLTEPKNRKRMYVPLFAGEFGDDNDLPLDPYLLGLLMGDGSFTDTSCSLHFTVADKTVLERFRAALPSSCEAKLVTRYDYRIVNRQRNNEPTSVAMVIKELGLFGHLSYDKFIPEQYLRASKHSRRELLRGLLETDGWAKGFSRVEFYTSSERLANDVIALVRGLGGIANFRTQYTNYTYKGLRKQGRKSWRIGLLHPFGRDLLTLPKHRERAKDQVLSTGQSRRTIISVESSGQAVEMACIKVSHPSQTYITDGYVVTHNTTLAHHLSARLGLPLMVIRPDDVHGQYIGSNTAKLKSIFDAVENFGEPVALFFDEMETVAQKRMHSGLNTVGEHDHNAMVNTLLARLEALDSIVIGATNRADAIDPAIWRRFDIHITLELPGPFERQRILARYLDPYGLPKRDLEDLAESFETASPALMRSFCEGMKRHLVIGPKVGWDMRKEAVIERLIAALEPHPDLGRPRLWTLGTKDQSIRSMPWPLPLAADIPAEAVPIAQESENKVVSLPRRAP